MKWSPRLSIMDLRLMRRNRLPGVDGLADERVHRLGERGAGLVGRDVEQADGVPAGRLCSGHAGICLPSDASKPEAADLVRAEAGKEPGQRESAKQFDGVEGTPPSDRVVLGVGVESGPHEFGPDLVVDDARIWANQGPDTPSESRVHGLDRTGGLSTPTPGSRKNRRTA